MKYIPFSNLIRIAALSVAAVAMGAAAAHAAAFAFEAEAAHSITKPFQVVADSKASGGRCVIQPLKSGRPPAVSCAATYKLQISTPGTYHVWGRVLWPNGCANSVDLQMDGGKRVTLGQDGTYNRWHWVQLKGATFKLTRGAHTMQMLNREDGPEVDQFYFTTDEDYVPVGIERATAGILAH